MCVNGYKLFHSYITKQEKKGDFMIVWVVLVEGPF